MGHIWLTSRTVAQTGAFGQMNIFITKKNYCDQRIRDTEAKSEQIAVTL